MLQNWGNVSTPGNVDLKTLSTSLKNLEKNGLIAINVRAQNAGVIIRRVDMTIAFDAFEVSCSNTSVLATQGRLIRKFPGRCVNIPAKLLQDGNFREHVAKTLQQMAQERIFECRPKTKKSGSEVFEERDTIHPGFVTENFFNILEALGEVAPLMTFRKHIRDDVIWHNSHIPWRRSSFWLVLKVSLQYALKHAFPEDLEHKHYKNFMLFLMSKVTDIATAGKIEPDILAIMKAKIGRRSYKMGSQTMEFVSTSAMSAVEAVQASLEKSWLVIHQRDVTRLPKLLPSAADGSILSLSNSRKYLENTISRIMENPGLSTFKPDSFLRICPDKRKLPKLIITQDHLGRVIILEDLAEWVEKHLSSWLKAPKQDQDCTALATLLKSYLELTKKEYQNMPQEYSLALLTMLELWVALDKVCTNLYPLLSTFGPEISSTFLEPLLLPKIGHMQRLQEIELYIELRKKECKPKNPSIFTDSGSLLFGAQYCKSSQHHQNLKMKIEHDAKEKRSWKETEWREKTERYRSLVQEASGLSHDTDEDMYGYPIHPKSRCRKCNLERDYRRISIQSHEWPLPTNPHMAHSVIYELDTPEALVAWRDTTWALLQDLGRTKTIPGKKCEHRILEYDQLKRYAMNRRKRVTLGSTTKSFLQAHYKEWSFPVDLERVCVNNGFHFQLIDTANSSSSTWIQDQNSEPSISRLCTTSLPEGPYSNLQDTVNSYTHTQNEVLSRQAKCSSELNISEFIAFGSLRAGECTQWINIIRELGSANLSFNDPAVFILINQAALQAGSSSKDEVRRVSHRLFLGEEFCSKLTGLLEQMHQKIEGNWKEQEMMGILIKITLRTVSLTLQSAVRSRAIALLRRARQTTIKWCHSLEGIISKSNSQESFDKTRLMILKGAILCRLTYDVDREHLRSVLSSHEDVANFIKSSILIFDNTIESVTSLSNFMRRYVKHAWRVAQNLECQLHDLIQKDAEGLLKVLRTIWEDIIMNGNWSFLESDNRSWVFNQTTEDAHGNSQIIHYNIISGELLIDGRPFGHIPKKFMEHSLYQRLFGPVSKLCGFSIEISADFMKRMLRVCASSMQGMLYMAAIPGQSKHKVHLGMIGSQLLIRVQYGQQILEAIPHAKFVDDLPRYFKDNFSHWLNIQTGEIELRPLRKCWESSEKNSRISFTPNSNSYMTQPGKRLMDVHSDTTKKFASILRGMDHAENIHVTRFDDGVVVVELIRLNLRFFVNDDGQLESKELDAVVDSSQSLGTLHGLLDRLVLQHRSSEGRSVLIPFGKVLVQKNGKHVDVAIEKPQGSRVQHFHYKLDKNLHKLRSSQGLVSELYLAYLHALTSFPVPDSFTGMTGTEEALTILRRESLRGFLPLKLETSNLLKQISELSPESNYYPPHRRSMEQVKTMQQVIWNSNLSQLSQHDKFCVLVEDIISHTKKFSMLYDQKDTISSSSRGSQHLLSRARQRNSGFRSYEFGGDIIDPKLDKIYPSRDQNADSERGRRVYQIASLINDWPCQLNVPANLAQIMSKWGDVSGYKVDLDPKCFGDLIGLSFSKKWGSLYNLCRFSKKENDTYNLIFLFCPVVFGQAKAPLLVRTLLACAFYRKFQALNAPPYSSFNFNNNSPNRQEIENALKKHSVPFVEGPPGFEKGTTADQMEGKTLKSTYQQDLSNQVKYCLDSAVAQWPCQYPRLTPQERISHIQREPALRECRRLFAEWYRNHQFVSHIENVQDSLDMVYCPETEINRMKSPIVTERPRLLHRNLPKMSDLIANTTCPDIKPLLPPLSCKRPSIPNLYHGDYDELNGIIADLEASSEAIQSEYGENLRQSFRALERGATISVPQSMPFEMETLSHHLTCLHTYVEHVFQAIVTSLRPTTQHLKIAELAGLWPSFTPQSLLRLLTGASPVPINAAWRQAVVKFGEAISMLQRTERLILYFKQNDLLGFYKECENIGRDGWKAVEYPDWLLMEIENDFRIRPIQARVAFEMISPSSGKNSVLQLNMGEGKSSVIIPMVAVALANQSCLARIITLKPLLRQTEYLLSQRIGGLVNRRLYHTPFSRRTNLSKTVVQKLQQLFEECKERRGITLVLPEHLLSLRLMSREQLSIDRDLAKHLLEMDQWLQLNARDILDESDEILDTRFQLVYTIGNQQLLDGQPDRWIIIQSVFSCANRYFDDIILQGGIEVDRKHNSFPTISFRDEDAQGKLLQVIIEDIVQGKIPAISLGYCSRKVLCAVKEFISTRSVNDETADLIMATFEKSTHMNVLFLLRGLFAHGILIFALQKKRWMVDYGLDPARCMMAVPYMAKGVPELISEFGHPDVALLLTCLSYYYTGITPHQIRRCIDLIFKESDPTLEYDRWCKSCRKLPEQLKDLYGINMEDEGICAELFTHFKYNKYVADFFLSRVVFPREGKEFLKKISSSGWDIPASEEGHPTTGFSGTNDNRFLLPLSIKQQDLSELHKTNAEVLNLLLRPENRCFVSMKDKRGQKLSGCSLVECIAKQPQKISVLIDVGAQVLEMRNQNVAKEWLKNVLDAKAAVYFDKGDEAMVLSRDGHVERLVASAFHQRLDGCLVYLDEVHTRGVDLRLPASASAAVVLGPRLCKDKLVQACMRMRNLSHGQSLVFFGSPEQERSIRNAIKNNKEHLDSGDIVRWVLQQTCRTTDSMRPLWVTQGIEHCKRNQAYQELLFQQTTISEALLDESRVLNFYNAIQEREARSLSEMYGLSDGIANPFSNWAEDDPISRRLIQEWKKLDISSIMDCSMHEEQEREISHEIETERQVQRPPPAKPLKHSLHSDVVHFATYGVFPAEANTFTPAFATIQETSAGQFLDPNLLRMNVFVTEDFTSVVQHHEGSNKDEYLRPVNWILSSTKTKDVVIISPYEADRLILKLEGSSVVYLHVYAQQTSKTMSSFENLQFYSIPTRPMDISPPEQSLQGLSLFSGSLYFPDYTRYKILCNFLGIVTSTTDDSVSMISIDGFVDPEGRNRIGWPSDCPFGKSPIPFFKAFISLRMKGQGYIQSHMGGLVNGKLLTEDSFNF